MNKFINRVRELQALRECYALPGSSLFVLYGRRRLGKTRLLREFASGTPAVYHMADRSTERDALRSLARSMAMALNEPALEAVEYPDWYALFGAFDRFRKGREGKGLLILDEYQYLAEAQPAMSSILQKWWDEQWSRDSLMVVLSGSLVSMMYRETLARSSPLYGRRAGQWNLAPLRFGEVREFFPRLPGRDRVALWALTGGVPYYAVLAQHADSFAEALRALVLTKGGALYDEPRFLLREEVTAPSTYASILDALGNGVGRISEIAGRLALPANQLTRYLSVLQELGLVRREVSVTERDAARSKRGFYQMTDPFLRLWFGCVRRYESLLELGQIQQAERLMAPQLTGHLAWAFEEVCRQYVEDRAVPLGVVRVGRFWDASSEVDVVGVDEMGSVVLAGECKWTSRPVGVSVGKELAAKTERWTDPTGTGIRLVVFSAAGFDAAIRSWAAATGALLLDLKDLAE